MCKIPIIHFHLHYVECIKEMSSADNSDMKISEAAHQNLIKDGYHSSNKNYILQLVGCKTHRFRIKSRVCLLMHVIESDPSRQRQTYAETF